jgi:RimJ/RimL family protein N-acetyltransferase
MEHKTEFLAGEKVVMRAFQTEDLPYLHAWLNDPEATFYMTYGQRPTTLAQAQQFIEKQLADTANVVFILCEKERGQPIGLAGLYDMEDVPKRGEYRIFIGDKTHWKKGIGTEVAQLLTWHAFDRLNLHRLFLGVNAENVGAVKSYEKAGFKIEGTLRDEMYRNGRYYNMIRMAVLRPEYETDLRAVYDAKFGISKTTPSLSPNKQRTI